MWLSKCRKNSTNLVKDLFAVKCGDDVSLLYTFNEAMSWKWN